MTHVLRNGPAPLQSRISRERKAVASPLLVPVATCVRASRKAIQTGLLVCGADRREVFPPAGARAPWCATSSTRRRRRRAAGPDPRAGRPPCSATSRRAPLHPSRARLLVRRPARRVKQLRGVVVTRRPPGPAKPEPEERSPRKPAGGVSAPAQRKNNGGSSRRMRKACRYRVLGEQRPIRSKLRADFVRCCITAEVGHWLTA